MLQVLSRLEEQQKTFATLLTNLLTEQQKTLAEIRQSIQTEQKDQRQKQERILSILEKRGKPPPK